MRYINANGKAMFTDRMCGDNIASRQIIDSYGAIFVNFISDASNTGKGFNLFFGIGEYEIILKRKKI